MRRTHRVTATSPPAAGSRPRRTTQTQSSYCTIDARLLGTTRLIAAASTSPTQTRGPVPTFGQNYVMLPLVSRAPARRAGSAASLLRDRRPAADALLVPAAVVMVLAPLVALAWEAVVVVRAAVAVRAAVLVAAAVVTRRSRCWRTTPSHIRAHSLRNSCRMPGSSRRSCSGLGRSLPGSRWLRTSLEPAPDATGS